MIRINDSEAFLKDIDETILKIYADCGEALRVETQREINAELRKIEDSLRLFETAKNLREKISNVRLDRITDKKVKDLVFDTLDKGVGLYAEQDRLLRKFYDLRDRANFLPDRILTLRTIRDTLRYTASDGEVSITKDAFSLVLTSKHCFFIEYGDKTELLRKISELSTLVDTTVESWVNLFNRTIGEIEDYIRGKLKPTEILPSSNKSPDSPQKKVNKPFWKGFFNLRNSNT